MTGQKDRDPVEDEETYFLRPTSRVAAASGGSGGTYARKKSPPPGYSIA